MKILVLGGGGFIGSWVVDRLLEEAHAVRVLERDGVRAHRRFESHERLEWTVGDLFSRPDLVRALAGVDAVVHLVSSTVPKSSNDNPIFDVQTNLVGTLQALDCIVDQGVRQVVFLSSGGTVYGNPQYLPIDENHPTNPQVSYGITKLAIEKYLLMYARLHDICPVILRVSNPYGERQRLAHAQGVVGAFISGALRGQTIEIWGDGTVTRDFLHVSDVAAACSVALRYRGTRQIFNISSGTGLSVNGLITMIEDILGRRVPCKYQAGREFDVPVSVLNNRLAREELDWAPQVDMPAGLGRTIAWFAAHQQS